MGIGWPLTVTAVVLNQCCFYSVFGKSTQFQRKKSVLSQTHLGSHSRFATHALYKRGRIIFNALSFRFIIYKMEAVILTFQVAEYVTCGGYSIDKESLFLHSSLTNLAEMWRIRPKSGLSVSGDPLSVGRRHQSQDLMREPNPVGWRVQVGHLKGDRHRRKVKV